MGSTVKSQTESRTALLFGLGYTAKALLPALKAAGYNVIATVRRPEKAERLSKLMGVRVLTFTGSSTPEIAAAISEAEIILSSAGPSDAGRDPVLNAVPDIAERAKKVKWAGYLSATSVYGDRGGKWAFAWLESGLPIHVFRLAGIYGPNIFGQSRNAFDRIRMGRAKAVVKPGHVVNRIHVEDIASVVMASIERPNPVQIYNVADGNPAPPQNVLEFAADLIKETRPDNVNFETAELSDMARSFYTETKRIDNSRAQNELGWMPRFATYRDGLCNIYRSENFDKNSFLLAGHIIVPDEDLEAVRRELPSHKAATEAEPGCLRFDVFQDLENKHKFHVFEVFKSEQAFRDHKARMQGTDWVKASANVERSYTVLKAE